MTTGLYLYGIFPQPGPTDVALTGIDQQPVQTRQVDDFVILFSDAQKPKYPASRRNLLGHERVLEEAMSAGHRTLLPLQFGLVIQDWQRVNQDLLMPYGDSLKALLDKLEGQREVSVKVMWDEATELARLLAENQTLQAERNQLEGKPLSMEEVIRIGQSVEAAMTERKAMIATHFLKHLSPLAMEVVENQTLTSDMIYNAAFLIPWQTEAQFSEAIEALDEHFEGRLRIRYNNFTAPFNFAQLQRN